MPKIDITGQKFFNWKVWVFVGFDEDGQAMFICQCKCGRIDVVRGADLRHGKTTQCVDCADRQMGRARDHKDIDGIEYKHCPNCYTWRPLEYFHKGNGWDGLATWCTFCNGYHNSAIRSRQ